MAEEKLITMEDDGLGWGQAYLGDKRLPREGISNIAITPDMLMEVKKCKDELLYFSENYFFITTQDEGKRKINLYPFQKKVLKALQKHRFNIVCSSRQIGKTTMMTIYALWLACFNNDKRIVIVANKERTAIMVLRRLQLAYRQLPNWLKPSIKAWGAKEVIFENDSSIAISTTSGSAVRGETLNVLIIDEMAHIEDHIIEDFWASVIPTVAQSRNTKIFAVSTPKGTGNKFYELFSKAERNESEWHAEKIYWWEVPEHGKKWAKEMLDALGGDTQLFAQEFENVFLESGESAVDAEVIKHQRALCRDPEYVLEDGHYKIWEEPNPKHSYVIGVDVGEGIGRAGSVAQILDITDLTCIKQVATFHDNMIDPRHFAEKLFKIANHWGKPPMLVERNNCGAEVVNTLQDTYNYEKLVAYGALDRDTGKPLMNDSRPGILSHTNVKYAGISNMRYWMNSLRVMEIYDLATVHEIETFVRNPNGTWSKQKGDNIFDDRVLSLVWALFVLEDPIVTGYFEVEKRDDRGKPLVIIPYTFEEPRFYKIDSYYQTGGGSTPSFISFDGSGGSELQNLQLGGWRRL